MRPCYRHIFSLNRLELAVHLGYYTPERKSLQPVEVSARLYFPEAPECVRDDHGKFIDYAKLADIMQAVVAAREFRLLEYLATELFDALRQFLDARGCAEVKIWLRATKRNAPVPHLTGGASFTTSDLPAEYSAIPAE